MLISNLHLTGELNAARFQPILNSPPAARRALHENSLHLWHLADAEYINATIDSERPWIGEFEYDPSRV